MQKGSYSLKDGSKMTPLATTWGYSPDTQPAPYSRSFYQWKQAGEK